MSPHLNAENAEELSALCSGRSRREIEALLAERVPRADVRDSVRRIEALSADRFGVHFTADSEFLELFERARALASHRLPTGDMARVLQLGLRALIREAEKERFAVGRKPRRKVEARAAEVHPPGALSADVTRSVEVRASEAHSPGGRGASVRPKRTRHIPAAVARAVYERGGGRCSFVSADGRLCGCGVFLELDHVKSADSTLPGRNAQRRRRPRRPLAPSVTINKSY